ncbi:MAG TPA: hypothetical protein VJT73_18260 [Polyangiaceae bacterium]|nr:hypothetical protein [Polyangiaceae bacterium]
MSARRAAWALALLIALGCAHRAVSDGTGLVAQPSASPSGAERAAVAESRTTETPVTAAPWPLEKAPTARTAWCTESVSALDEETCYVVPPSPTRTLLVYFHGIVPPEQDSEENGTLQRIIAKSAQKAGIVALVPRGKQGLAPRGRERWWGWPTNQASYSAHGAAIVAAVLEKRKQLERLLGVSFVRTYVAGSSSGAYFVTRLALQGGLDADGFGAMSGGSVPDAIDLDRIVKRPFYIGYGQFDPARSTAHTLAGLLRGAGWSVREARHPFGHGARAVYIEEALAFFRAEESGPSPPNEMGGGASTTPER